MTDAIDVVANGARTCSIDADGQLLCWGLEYRDGVDDGPT